MTYGTFMAQTYRYDGADNVVYFEDVKSTGSARWMGYDAVDRLVDVASPGRWGDWGYQYDELGNRTSKARLPASGDYQAVGYQYDANNRLTVSAGPEPVSPMSLEWDRAGRLSKTTNTLTGVATSYVYDGHGRRVEKGEPAETTVYHYDAAGRVAAETGPDGAKRRDYIYLGNKLVAVDSCVTGNSPACAEWYHTDALGSVAARTNGTGTIVAQLDYQPWGEQWLVQGDGGDRQYNGRVYDPGTGFHDYGARMYWPQIGRFISADSVMGSPGSPMTLNRYSYVLNNPYKYTDPSGNGAEAVLPLLDGMAIWCMEGGCQRAYDTAIGLLMFVDTLEAGRQLQAQQAKAAPAPVAASAKPAQGTGKTTERPRFVAQPDGQVVDTQATPQGSYDQPSGGRTDVLQKEDHGAGQSHTHDPVVRTNPKTGESFVNGREKPGRPVSAADVRNIESGKAPPSDPKGR